MTTAFSVSGVQLGSILNNLSSKCPLSRSKAVDNVFDYLKSITETKREKKGVSYQLLSFLYYFKFILKHNSFFKNAFIEVKADAEIIKAVKGGINKCDIDFLLDSVKPLQAFKTENKHSKGWQEQLDSIVQQLNRMDTVYSDDHAQLVEFFKEGQGLTGDRENMEGSCDCKLLERYLNIHKTLKEISQRQGKGLVSLKRYLLKAVKRLNQQHNSDILAFDAILSMIEFALKNNMNYHVTTHAVQLLYEASESLKSGRGNKISEMIKAINTLKKETAGKAFTAENMHFLYGRLIHPSSRLTLEGLAGIMFLLAGVKVQLTQQMVEAMGWDGRSMEDIYNDLCHAMKKVGKGKSYQPVVHEVILGPRERSDAFKRAFLYQ